MDTMGNLLTNAVVIAALIGSVVNIGISLWTNYKNRAVLRETTKLRSRWEKENIGYQIYQTELSKRKFERSVLCVIPGY